MAERNIAKKLAGTTVVYFIASFSSKILSFLLLPLYTSKLTPTEYGSVDMVFTVAQFLVPVISMTIQNAAFRFLVDTDSFDERKKIISNSFVLLFINSVISALVTMIAYFVTNNVFVLLGGIYIIGSCWSTYMLQMYRGIKHNKMYAFMGVFNAGLHIGLNVVFIAGLNMGSVSLLLSPIFGFLATSVIMLFTFRFYKYISFKEIGWDITKELIKYALPFIPNNIIWWFLSGFAKLHLSTIHGEAALGLYSIANKFSDMLISLYSIFHLAWTETAYETYNNKNRNAFYSAAYNKIAKVMLSLIMVILPMTKVCVPVFLNESYQDAIKYMPLLYAMTYINILSTFYGSGFQCAKKTNGMMISSIVGAGVNIVFCLLLIPKLGIWGATISLTAANIALLLVKKYMSKRFFDIKPDWKCYLLLVPISFFMISFYSYGIVVNVVCSIAAVLIAVVVNIDILKTFFVMFKRHT